MQLWYDGAHYPLLLPPPSSLPQFFACKSQCFISCICLLPNNKIIKVKHTNQSSPPFLPPPSSLPHFFHRRPFSFAEQSILGHLLLPSSILSNKRSSPGLWLWRWFMIWSHRNYHLGLESNPADDLLMKDTSHLAFSPKKKEKRDRVIKWNGKLIVRDQKWRKSSQWVWLHLLWCISTNTTSSRTSKFARHYYSIIPDIIPNGIGFPFKVLSMPLLRGSQPKVTRHCGILPFVK